MLGEAIKKRIDKRPFQPFVLYITNGDKVEIRHPERAFLTRGSVVVGHGSRAGIADYALEYRLIHVVKIAPTNGRHRATENGRGKRRRTGRE